ncbi:MAG TPA: outer membrane lipoprotein-sorting protein [Blastocatellia bacterium]|nr:outer membrane lipoprotein-sorting protein [Blastocatellia bacterium]
MQPNKIAPLILLCASLCGCGGKATSNAPLDSSALIATTPAPLPDAGAMIKRMITQSGCKDFTADMRIATEDGKSKRDLIEFRVQRKYSGDRTVTFLSVLAPAEDTNKALLAIEIPDQPTQAFSYLPGLKRLTRINSDRQLGYRNAKVTVQDMLGMELGQYDHGSGERVNLDGEPLIKVEFKEKLWRNLAYPRIIGYFREKDQNPAKFEIYDHHDELRKRVRVEEVKQIQNRQTITRLSIEDIQQKLKVKIETRKIDYDRGLSDNLFTEARLKSIINDAVQRLDQQ